MRFGCGGDAIFFLTLSHELILTGIRLPGFGFLFGLQRRTGRIYDFCLLEE